MLDERGTIGVMDDQRDRIWKGALEPVPPCCQRQLEEFHRRVVEWLVDVSIEAAGLLDPPGVVEIAQSAASNEEPTH